MLFSFGCAVLFRLFRLAESFAAKLLSTCHWLYDRRQRLGTVVKRRGWDMHVPTCAIIMPYLANYI